MSKEKENGISEEARRGARIKLLKEKFIISESNIYTILRDSAKKVEEAKKACLFAENEYKHHLKICEEMEERKKEIKANLNKEAFDELKEFLKRREYDIAHDIEDFSGLLEAFQQIFNRQPKK